MPHGRQNSFMNWSNLLVVCWKMIEIGRWLMGIGAKGTIEQLSCVYIHTFSKHNWTSYTKINTNKTKRGEKSICQPHYNILRYYKSPKFTRNENNDLQCNWDTPWLCIYNSTIRTVASHIIWQWFPLRLKSYNKSNF